jgi:hypothetical protein
MKFKRNPYQDRINALNFKDIDEGLKTDALLKKSRTPIPDDINSQRFPMTDMIRPNVLKPEELSMKDLLDELQTQTILNNNIAPFVKKEIKSEVTQAMIDQFKFESSKPVKIGDTFYKFKPPGVDLTLTEVPPPFPNEDQYYATLRELMKQEIKISKELDRQRDIFNLKFQGKRQQFNDGTISKQEFLAAKQNLDKELDKVSVAVLKNSTTLSNLERDVYMYDEYKLDYDTKVNLIQKENKKKLANYEDEIASRNKGLEMSQQVGESDMDYAQRMIDTAQETIDPDTVETQAKLFLYTSLKNLMSQLVQPYKAEAILNAIITAGGYEKLQPIKEQFTAIKKKLEDTFGNLSNVSTDSIAQVMFDAALKPTIRTPVTTPTSSALTTAPTIVPSSIRPPIAYSPTQYLRTKREPKLAPLFVPEEEFFNLPEVPRKASPKTPSAAEIPMPTLGRSKSLEERLAGKTGRSESQMTNKELTKIIIEKGLPLSSDQTENYVTVKEAGLLPPKLVLIDRDAFLALGQSRMAEYLEVNKMVGRLGGVPVSKSGQPKSTDELIKMFDRYKQTGSGFKSEHIFNIKDKFAIVDGEIHSGNNNPQLLRDARKMLKEMVQQKLVTLYEAQSHMKHLRKLNKI